MYDDNTPMAAEDKRVSLMRQFVDLSDRIAEMQSNQRDLDERQSMAAKEREQVRRDLLSIIEPAEKSVGPSEYVR